jgi:uncharacterized protein
VAQTFEWDESKASANEHKHGVSFAEAVTVFEDPLSITISDSQHSEEEDRFVDIGESDTGRLLVVAYTERDATIRIIRRPVAASTERKAYERHTT